MAATVSVYAKGAANSSTTVNSGYVTTTAGSGTVFVMAIAMSGNVTVSSATDSKSNTYTLLGTKYATTGFSYPKWYAFYYCANPATGGANTRAQVTFGSATYSSVFFGEITGVATSNALDQYVDWTEDATSPFVSGTTGTTTQAAEIALAFIGWESNEGGASTTVLGNSYTKVDEYTDFSNYNTLTWGYKNLSSTGAQQSSLTDSNGYITDTASIIVTFKEPEAAPAGQPTTLRHWGIPGMGYRR